MKTRKTISTRRHLNQHSFLLGLSTLDVSVIGALSAIATIVANRIGVTEYNLSILGGCLASAFLLMPIRMRYRRKIIRDTAKFFLTPGLLYDPKDLSLKKLR